VLSEIAVKKAPQMSCVDWPLQGHALEIMLCTTDFYKGNLLSKIRFQILSLKKCSNGESHKAMFRFDMKNPHSGCIFTDAWSIFRFHAKMKILFFFGLGNPVNWIFLKIHPLICFESTKISLTRCK